MKRIIYLFIFLFIAVAGIYPAETSGLFGAEEGKRANVLFISSYTMSFDTIPPQITGIQSVITEEEAEIDYEFMDTKRFSDDEDIELFYNSLNNKLKRLDPYDAVIVGDDAALIFAMKNHEELFYQTPVVFLGINSPKLALEAAESPYFTGIIEETSYKQNIEIAKKLYPKATEIVGIVDNSLTGQGDKVQFEMNSKQFPEYEFRLINSSELTQAELGEEISKLDEKSILFYLSMFEDKDGNSYVITQSTRFLAKHSNIPIFRMSIGGVGSGVLGGVMVSYEESGRIAAEMANDIIMGIDPASIEVIMESPNFPYFDYNMMAKHGISTEKIPKDSIIVNLPVSFFAENRQVLEVAFVVLSFLLVIVFILSVNYTKRVILINTDYLTEMKNRMWMTNRIKSVLQKGKKFALFFMDIDDFKNINDAYGHSIGDMLLIQTAERISSLDIDIEVARFGGDEFIGIINSSDKSEILEICKDVVKVFDEKFVLDKNEIIVTASMGVACAPEDTDNVDVLMSYADTAMYNVKDAGKNSVQFFNLTMKKGLERQEFVARELRNAIYNDGICMAYQPQICAGTREVVGFEALVRLKSGSAMPNEFIHIAEENGLIIPLGRIITQLVIRQIALWRDMGYGEIHVAINFSNAQLRDMEYPRYVKDLLEEYEVEPYLLEIEITESIFLRQVEESISFMNQLHGYGLNLSMDDFGTGYSAISYLSYVPFSKLKIDKSLLDKYASPAKSKIIASVINLAHSLGLKVTAEGIETEEVAEMLERLECDYMQGYLFGKPQDSLAAEAFLSKTAK